MDLDVPADPFSITAEWLTTALGGRVLGGATVTGVGATDIGEGTGIFGEIVRLDLTTNGGDGTAPATVIAKMACTEPANLEVALQLGIFERELAFFEEIAPTTSLKVPACHLALRSGDGRFVLLLEDLEVDHEVGDQVAGATLQQAEAVVDALAPFHARWWEDPSLDSMSWLPRPDAPAYVAAVPTIYSAGLPVLRAEWTDRVSPEAVRLAHDVEPVFLELMHRTATGPATLIHTDTRLDNIFFSRADPDEVAFIDFQLVLRGRGVADVAYLIGTSVRRDEAKQGWEQVLRRWFDAITSTGIEYRWDDCVRHYREAALYYLSGAMSLLGSFDTGNERGAALAAAYSTRILEHVVDIDARSVLPVS